MSHDLRHFYVKMYVIFCQVKIHVTVKTSESFINRLNKYYSSKYALFSFRFFKI